MDPVLEMVGLEKVFRPGLLKAPVRALRGLSLRVRAGEIHALVGPNGAGKTTTLKILLGLLRPSAGQGRLLGRPLGDREARRRLGFLPELPAYPPHLTVGEVLRFARALSGAGRDDGADLGLLRELGLEGHEGRPVRRLSKGQVQRLGLAQALVHGPELIILDEPMSGLDPVGRGLVKELLRRERLRGRTVLLSSHILADVEALADTVSFLHQGRLLVEGRPADLLGGSVYDVAIEGEGPADGNLLAEMPPASTFSLNAGSWSILLRRPRPEQVDACLRRVILAGCRIGRVEKVREDLETFFLRRLGEEERAGQAGEPEGTAAEGGPGKGESREGEGGPCRRSA
jgi:ABC-2 type transport system ATP-binding protein